MDGQKAMHNVVEDGAGRIYRVHSVGQCCLCVVAQNV